MTNRENHAEPALSIVIPSYQRPDLLHRCLASVTRFAPPATEIIVVDDASQNSCASRVAGEFPQVSSQRLNQRGGFCVAVNHGIRAAQAPIVELLNDDTEVEAGWVEAAIRCFVDPNVVAVAPLVLRFASTTEHPQIDSAGDSYHLGGFANKRCNGVLLSQCRPVAAETFGASASSAFYRRQALLRIGLFPESFRSYFEDVDVSFRLRHDGGKVVFAPDSRVWHHVHASHGKSDRRLVEQQSLNEERVFWRNMPNGLLSRALPLHAAVLAAKAWRRWREGTLLPFLVGRLRAAAEFRNLWRERRGIVGRSRADLESWPLDSAWRTTPRLN